MHKCVSLKQDGERRGLHRGRPVKNLISVTQQSTAGVARSAPEGLCPPRLEYSIEPARTKVTSYQLPAQKRLNITRNYLGITQLLLTTLVLTTLRRMKLSTNGFCCLATRPTPKPRSILFDTYHLPTNPQKSRQE